MIVDHADGLGEGVDDHRAAEIEAALFQFLRQSSLIVVFGGNLF